MKGKSTLKLFLRIFAKSWLLASARDKIGEPSIWPATAVPVSHWWAQPVSWRLFPGPFWGVLLGHVPCHGRTKADAIKLNGFKVQTVEQVRDISSCQLKLLYVDHKYFQTYVYSMNHYSGAWRGSRVFSFICIQMASHLKGAIMPAEWLHGGWHPHRQQVFKWEWKWRDSLLHTNLIPQGLHILRHFLIDLNLT